MPDLDPLPQGDRSDDLQQISLARLRTLLPPDRFLVRDERVDDKGVDGGLEVKVRSRFTNFRAQFQLKATDSTARNADGSFSLPVATSNLNYLLNGSSALYFVWLEARGEMRFVWARDELTRLNKDNPAWREQGEVTLRFQDVLGLEALDAIHARVVAEGRLQRQTQERLAEASTAGPVTVHIDPRSLDLVDVDALAETVRTSGAALVASGYGPKVLAAIDLLRPPARTEPRVLLVAGYAHATARSFLDAVGPLARAALGRAELSEHDRHMLAALQNICDFHTARTDRAGFLRREGELAATAPAGWGFQHRLEVLRSRYFRERDDAGRQAYREFREVVATVLTADVPAPVKLKARMTRLFLDSGEQTSQVLFFVVNLQGRRQAALPEDSPAIRDGLGRLAAGIREWNREIDEIVEAARTMGHPLLIADALATRVFARIQTLVALRFWHRVRNHAALPLDPEHLETLHRDAEAALATLVASNSLERELGVRLLQAELAELEGDPDRAKVIAADVLTQAEAMGFSNHVTRARQHLSGDTAYARLVRIYEAGTTVEPDAGFYRATDDKLDAIARNSLQVLELPESYLPVLVRETRVCREAARQRYEWCRHLEILTVDVNRPPAELFLTDPCRRVVCQLHHRHTVTETSHAGALVSSFKAMHCEGCPTRDPKPQAVSPSS